MPPVLASLGFGGCTGSPQSELFRRGCCGQNNGPARTVRDRPSVPGKWSALEPSETAPRGSMAAPAIAHASSGMPVSRWPSNTAAQDRTRQEPTERLSASSRQLCASGLMQNTGRTQNKEMLTCSLGSTITTASDPMVASTTSRQSAAPIPEQRLDHLQPPAEISDSDTLIDKFSAFLS